MIDQLRQVTRATLAYDLARFDQNLQRIAGAARAHDIRALFAVKSFPHPRALELAARRLDGFDVASPGELAAVPQRALVSVADPTGAAIAAASGARVIVACETIDQVRAAPAGADIAIRVSASITGLDPAIGAVLDGSGHRRSRFGLDDRASIAALRAAAGDRRVGLHVHHGPVAPATAERFVATARAAIELADFAPAFVDLGGAWHAIADLADAFARVRAALPVVELVVEPGRAYCDGVGYACGIVHARRSLGDRELVVADLSRACHLRWSTFELVARAPHPGQGRRVLVVGPTCYEEDVLGEWTIDPAELGDRVIVRGITGYALAWNTGFGGLAPADVLI